MEAVVKWSPKGRALLGLFVPVFAWLGWYSFTSSTHPSPGTGYFSIAATLLVLFFQLHAAVYRVEVRTSGIVEKLLWGERRVDWDDVQKVEAIAQKTDGNAIYRWSAAPESAFHVIVHSRKGRVSVHRWMTGVDEFIEALRVVRGTPPYRETETSPLDRNDPEVQPLLRRSPLNETVNRVYDGMVLVKVVVLVLPLSWIGGVIVAASIGFRLSGNPFLDGTVVALAPWGLGAVVYKLVAHARKNRFGAEHARPPLTAKDAILTMAAAMGGPLLLYGFAPRAASSREGVDLLLCFVGAVLCWMPIAEVRKCLRQAGPA